MLAIRMQRTGRKGHAQFRMVVQDSRRTPTSGRVVANLGSYNPHTKQANFDVEKATAYLSNGAQPSDRVVYLLKKEGVKIPAWVKDRTSKERSIKNIEKLRKNRPAEEATAAEVAPEEPQTEEAVNEVESEKTEEVVADMDKEVPPETAEEAKE